MTLSYFLFLRSIRNSFKSLDFVIVVINKKEIIPTEIPTIKEAFRSNKAKKWNIKMQD